MKNSLDFEEMFNAIKAMIVREKKKAYGSFNFQECGVLIDTKSPNTIGIYDNSSDDKNTYIKLTEKGILMKSDIVGDKKNAYCQDYLEIKMKPDETSISLVDEENYSHRILHFVRQTDANMWTFIERCHKEVQSLLNGYEYGNEEFKKAASDLSQLSKKFETIARKAIAQKRTDKAVEFLLNEGDLTGITSENLTNLKGLFKREFDRRLSEIIDKIEKLDIEHRALYDGLLNQKDKPDSQK